MSCCATGDRPWRLPVSLAFAACLNACLLDPQGPPTPQREAGGGHPDSVPALTVAFRALLPESAAGRVDSAELRMREPGGKPRSWPLAVSGPVLEARLDGLEPGPAEFEVVAFASGRASYSGSLAWDPSRAGAAEVTVALGPVGRVRIEAGFNGAGME